MVVEIRLYKTYDTDLVSLFDSGYPVFTMIRDAVSGYANGSPVHYFIDEPITFDMNNKTNVRNRFILPDSDVKACYLLKSIKHRYRNTFCKMILRNALVQQNLSPFFADPALSQLQGLNMAGRNLGAYPNLTLLSTIKEDDRQINVAGISVNIDKSRKEKRKKEPAITPPVQNNPFANMGSVSQPQMQPQPQAYDMQRMMQMFQQMAAQNGLTLVPQQDNTTPVSSQPAPVTEPIVNNEPSAESAPTTDEPEELETAGNNDLMKLFDAL